MKKLLTVFFVCMFACIAQASNIHSLKDVRNRVTIEHAYKFGTQIELVAKKGDVIRLMLNENPSGRKEIFLLPKDDALWWQIPSKWGTDYCSVAGGSYSPKRKEHFFGLSFDILVNVKALESADGMVTIEIADNGIGVKPEYQSAVFEMFRRLHTKNEYEGTGIGLAICRKIVEHHGGQIGVKSQLGQGSTFWFTLPEAHRNHENDELPQSGQTRNHISA